MQTTPFEDSRCATRPVGPRLVACPTTACSTTLSRKAVSRSWQRGPKTHGLVMDSRSVALKTVAPKIVMPKTAASATVVLRQRVRRARRVTVGLGSPLWIGHWVQKATVWRDRPTEGDIWQQWTTSIGVQNGGGRGSFPGRAVAFAQHHPSEEHVGKQFMATVPQSAACTIHASSLMGLAVPGRNLSETTTKNDNMQNHLDQRLFRQGLFDPLIDSPKERRSQCVVTCVVTNVRRRNSDITPLTTKLRMDPSEFP